MPKPHDSRDALGSVLDDALKRGSLIAVLKLLVMLVASLALAVGSLMAALGGAGIFAWTGIALFAGGAVVSLRGLLLEFGLATRRPRETAASPWVVSITGDHIACRYGRRKAERLAWSALTAVGLRADDAIPVGDVYWLLFDEAGGVCTVPISAQGSGALLGEMQQRLPGFDNEAVAEISSALDGGAIVWERPAVFQPS